MQVECKCQFKQHLSRIIGRVASRVEALMLHGGKGPQKNRRGGLAGEAAARGGRDPQRVPGRRRFGAGREAEVHDTSMGRLGGPREDPGRSHHGPRMAPRMALLYRERPNQLPSRTADEPSRGVRAQVRSVADAGMRRWEKVDGRLNGTGACLLCSPEAAIASSLLRGPGSGVRFGGSPSLSF